MVFKSQYSLICDRIFNTYEIHTFCLRDRGFRLIFSYKTTLYIVTFSYEYLRQILRENRNSYFNCLNDEQLFDISSSKTIYSIILLLSLLLFLLSNLISLRLLTFKLKLDLFIILYLNKY